jgi:hypothetical protein
MQACTTSNLGARTPYFFAASVDSPPAPSNAYSFTALRSSPVDLKHATFAETVVTRATVRRRKTDSRSDE